MNYIELFLFICAQRKTYGEPLAFLTFLVSSALLLYIILAWAFSPPIETIKQKHAARIMELQSKVGYRWHLERLAENIGFSLTKWRVPLLLLFITLWIISVVVMISL